MLRQDIQIWNSWKAQDPECAPDLRQADLRGAPPMWADLSQADLTNANLCGADLGFANLTYATLIGTDFSGAYMGFTTLASDLRGAKGLDTVKHIMPSYLTVDAIYRSQGEIPEVFLRGCGVPDDMIAFIHGIRGAIQFYSCFISYSTKNQDFADRLYADLQSKGVRCWFAPHDAQGGRKLHEQIDDAIRLHDKLLLILSEDSMNSEWVKTEISKARAREIRDGAKVLFPVRLCSFSALEKWRCFDTGSGEDHAPEIRKFYIPDFSNWGTKNKTYQHELNKLLRDLKPAEAAKA